MTRPAFWGDATIEDDGKIDAASFGAAELPVAGLPDECLLYLMGSRYCETDKLSQAAWDMFGNVATSKACNNRVPARGALK